MPKRKAVRRREAEKAAVLHVRLDRVEKRLIAEAAEVDGRSISNWVRRLLVAEARRISGSSPPA